MIWDCYIAMDLVEKSGGVEEKVFLKSEVHIGKMIYWRIIS